MTFVAFSASKFLVDLFETAYKTSLFWARLKQKTG